MRWIMVQSVVKRIYHITKNDESKSQIFIEQLGDPITQKYRSELNSKNNSRPNRFLQSKLEKNRILKCFINNIYTGTYIR